MQTERLAAPEPGSQEEPEQGLQSLTAHAVEEALRIGNGQMDCVTTWYSGALHRRCWVRAQHPVANGDVESGAEHRVDRPDGGRRESGLTKSKLAAAGLAAAVIVGGGASIAAASSSDTSGGTIAAASDTAQTDGETNDGPDGGPGSEQDAADPTFTGSVPAPASTEVPDGQESSGNDAAEKAALESLATVTQAQAEQAALAAVPGTVSETDLDSEGGFVVYSVEVTVADGSVTEVTVDAGNASVLAQQAGESGDQADGPDQPEGPNDPQD